MPGGLIGALGQFFQKEFGKPSAPRQQSPIPTFNDPIVADLHKDLANEHKDVPTEADQLKQEQHEAWGKYDFERCIVIFSRLHELEPDNQDWPDKLKTSYYNRGKQYETDGNIEKATQCYYAALQIDPNFPEAQQAAQELLQKQGAQTTA